MAKKELNNVVCCIGADTGKPIWEYKYESSEETLSTPALDDTSLYALSKEGILFCLNTKNGKLRWKKDLVAEYGAIRPYYGFSGSPVIVGEFLVLTVNTAGMGLNKNTGEMVWSSESPPKKIEAYDSSSSTGADYSTPVIYEQGGKHYALIASWKGISSVEVEMGKPLWVYEWELYSGRHITDPVLIGNRIYVADNYAGYNVPGSLLLEINGDRPTVLWKSPDLTTEITNAVIIDGYVYGGQGGPYKYRASLRCIDLETGKLMWDKKVSEATLAGCVSLMAADEKLVVLTDNGILIIAEASSEGYKEISRCAVFKEEDK